jgi:hypothetical protein
MYCINWDGWSYLGVLDKHDKDGHAVIEHTLKNPEGEVVPFEHPSRVYPTHQDLEIWVRNNG